MRPDTAEIQTRLECYQIAARFYAGRDVSRRTLEDLAHRVYRDTTGREWGMTS